MSSFSSGTGSIIAAAPAGDDDASMSSIGEDSSIVTDDQTGTDNNTHKQSRSKAKKEVIPSVIFMLPTEVPNPQLVLVGYDSSNSRGGMKSAEEEKKKSKLERLVEKGKQKLAYKSHKELITASAAAETDNDHDERRNRFQMNIFLTKIGHSVMGEGVSHDYV